jgi:hypothetical protein
VFCSYSRFAFLHANIDRNFEAWLQTMAIETEDALSGLISAFFLFQAVTNKGCCTSNSCAVDPKQHSLQENHLNSHEKLK